MNMTKLSVSSVILATVLSGCSQQQVVGTSQANGSQQQVEGKTPAVQTSPSVTPAPVRVYNKPVVKAQLNRKQANHISRSIQRRNGLPAAKPGQCFAKVKTAPKYVTKSKRVLIEKASTQRVLVRAPQYRWIQKKILVRKAQYINRTIPALYRNQTTKVRVRPAYHTWKKGNGAITRIDNMTGEVMCRVTVPATYKNVTKRVVVRPVQNIRQFIPAVYKTVKQKQRVSAAIYKTVSHPARYQTKNYRVQVAGARYVWRPVKCAQHKAKQHKHNRHKAALLQRSRVHKHAYKRPAASQGEVSYAQFLAVMNAPLKSKAPKKRIKRKIAKKMAMPKKVEPKNVTPKVMPKAAMPAKAPKMAPKVEAPKMAPKVEAPKADAPKAVAPKMAAKVDAAKKADSKSASSSKKAEIQQNIVYGIQASLKSKGYNPGKLDGKMGPNTAKALKAFQKSRGLPVGVLSKDTFRALGLVK